MVHFILLFIDGLPVRVCALIQEQRLPLPDDLNINILLLLLLLL